MSFYRQHMRAIGGGKDHRTGWKITWDGKTLTISGVEKEVILFAEDLDLLNEDIMTVMGEENTSGWSYTAVSPWLAGEREAKEKGGK